MIPPSYFFRQAYRDRFDEAVPREAEPRMRPGHGAFDPVGAAILGFASGIAHIALYPGRLAPHDRRR